MPPHKETQWGDTLLLKMIMTFNGKVGHKGPRLTHLVNIIKGNLCVSTIMNDTEFVLYVHV